jgi:hypothetical protein
MEHRVPFIVAELSADTNPFMLYLYAAAECGALDRFGNTINRRNPGC